MHALNTMISQEVCSRRERPSSLENYFLTFIAPCCVNTRSRNKKDRGRTIIYWTLSEPGPLLERLQISVPSTLKNQNPGVSITGTMYHESICVPAACNESRTEDQFWLSYSHISGACRGFNCPSVLRKGKYRGQAGEAGALLVYSESMGQAARRDTSLTGVKSDWVAVANDFIQTTTNKPDLLKKVITLKGTEASLSYIQRFLYLVYSSIYVSIFYIIWMDTYNRGTRRRRGRATN